MRWVALFPIVLLLIVFQVEQATANCLECADAGNEVSPYWGAKANGVDVVNFYIPPEATSSPYFSKDNVEKSVTQWNTTCNGAALPKLALIWGKDPPAGADIVGSPEYQKSLILIYLKNTPAEGEFDSQGNAVKGPHLGSNIDNRITLLGRCPTQQPKGGRWDIDCDGPFINWRTPGARNVFLHEFGHAFGLTHDKGTCPRPGGKGKIEGIMSETMGWSESFVLTDEHCQLADTLNDNSEICHGLPSVGDKNACTRCQVEVGGTISGLEGVEMVEVTLQVSAPGMTPERHDVEARTSFSFSGIVEGASYSVSVGTPRSQGVPSGKSCVVLPEDASGDVPSAGKTDIEIKCQCQPTTNNALTSCIPEFYDPIFELPPPILEDICEISPNLCAPEELPWWFLNGTNGTDCWSVPLDIIVIDDDGKTQIYRVEYVHCIGSASSASIERQGPEVDIDAIPPVLQGSAVLSGWARHPEGVSALIFIVDEEIVQAPLERGIERPEACGGTIGDCDPQSGFQAVIDTRGLSDGAHSLRIVALGGTQAPVGTVFETTVQVDNECGPQAAPSVSVAQPTSGAMLEGREPVSASATADGEIERVDFLVDGQLKFTDWTAPYEWTWDTRTQPDGSHVLAARVATTCGMTSVSAAVDVTVRNANDPPLSAVEFPTPLLDLSGLAPVSGWAVDADGVSSIVLRLGGQTLPLTSTVHWTSRSDVCASAGVADPRCPNVGWSTSFDTTRWPDGTYRLDVVAIDSRGGSIARSVSVWIRNTPIVAPIVSTPPSTTVVAGDDVSFQVTAAGEAPLSYQWQYRSGGLWRSLIEGERGGRVGGVRTRTLTIEDVAASDATGYRCVVTNGGGTSASGSASLTVEETISPPTVTAGLDQEVSEGETALLSVSAQGVGPLFFRWQRWNGSWAHVFDGGRLSGGATSVLRIADAVPLDQGLYRAVVSNEGGSAVSAAIDLTVDPIPVGSCQPSTTTLCFQADRFAVSAIFNGSPAQAMPFSQEGGFFWMFEPNTVEVVVKILDARTVNGHFWVFHGALTDLAYTLTVTDTITGTVKTYLKGAGNFCGDADTAAFGGSTSAGSLVPLGPSSVFAPSASCQSSPTAACLFNDKFRVEVHRGGAPQPGVAVSDLSASFGFVAPTAPEVVVKVIDGTSVNGWYWLFFGSLTHQAFTVEVTDTATGEHRSYASPADFCGEGDTAAF